MLMLDLSQLPKLRTKKRKRVGRGESSGRGKTAGRGHKGQKARSGRDIPRGFEGGQTPLKQRLPKFRGIKPRPRRYAVVTLKQLEAKFKNGETVSPATLRKKGLVDENVSQVKLIGDKITKRLKVKDCLLSAGAGKALQVEKKAEKK